MKLVYVIFFAWFSITGPLRPLANWDILPYVGAALSITGYNGELRSRSLSEIQKYITAEQYSSIIGGSYYTGSVEKDDSVFRETVAKDDKAFIEQLPAYLVKPGYVFLIGLIGTAIGNIALAAVLISAAGFSIMGVSLYLLRPPGLYEPFWLMSVLGVLYLSNPQLLLLTKAATPDSLAAGLMLMGFWAYIRKPQSILPIAFMSFAILTRPDSVITTTCLFPVFIKFSLDGIASIKWLLGSLLIPMAVYLLGKNYFPGFGLLELIIYTIKGPFPYLSSIDMSQLKQIYFLALYNDFLSLITAPQNDIFFITSLALLACSKNHYAKLIVLAALGNVIVKVVLFPNFDGGYQERFFFLSYFLVLFSAFNWQENPSFFGGKFKSGAFQPPQPEPGQI